VLQIPKNYAFGVWVKLCRCFPFPFAYFLSIGHSNLDALAPAHYCVILVWYFAVTAITTRDSEDEDAPCVQAY
jgi:hypothetical protein